MTKSNPPLEVVDTSSLTDADWAELNKLKAAYENGGVEALSGALEKLAADPVRYVTVMGALYPDMMREAIRDKMAEMGTTEDELRELLRKLQSSSPKSH
jgi:hypothetical protein